MDDMVVSLTRAACISRHIASLHRSDQLLVLLLPFISITTLDLLDLSTICISHTISQLAVSCTVDLEMGVRFQKCYDVDCRDYRSEYMPLPADIWEVCRMKLAQLAATLNAAAGDVDMHKQCRTDSESDRRSSKQVAMPNCPPFHMPHAALGLGSDSSAFDDACLELLAEFESGAARVSAAAVRSCNASL